MGSLKDGFGQLRPVLCRFANWFSGVAECLPGPVADCIGAGQNGFPVLIGPLAGIDRDLSGQDQQNGGVLGQGQEQFQELGDHQERGQDQKGKAGHGFSVSGACEGSSTDQHGQHRASPPKAQPGARTARRLVFLLDRTAAVAPSWPHRSLWPLRCPRCFTLCPCMSS